MSLYTFKRYHEEMLILYGADEGTTNDTVTDIDAGLPALSRAVALSRARREVQKFLTSYKQAWAAISELATYPASTDSINLASVLSSGVLSLLLVEEVRDTLSVPIYAASHDERWRGDLRAYPYAATLTGDLFELKPQPAALTLRFTYVPLLGHVTRADLTSERYDTEIPAAAQDAVPVCAAKNLGIGDVGRRSELAAEWENQKAQVVAAARLREGYSPRFPRNTRPRVGLSR